MLSYIKWKQLNESFAGAIPLGVTSPGSLGVRGGFEGTRIALEEAKKRSRKMMADVALGDDDDEEMGGGGGEDEDWDADSGDSDSGTMNPDSDDDMGTSKDGESKCSFCGKNSKKRSAKKSLKKSRKYMGSGMGDLGGGGGLDDLGGGGGDDFESGPPMHKKPKHKLGKHPLHGGDDPLDGGDGDDDDLDLDDPSGGGDLDDDPMGGGDDLDDPMGGGGDDDLDAGPPAHHGGLPHKKHPGGPLNKPGMDAMAMSRKMMKKRMAKKMKKESWWPDEDEWMASVRSMLTPQNVKYGDGWTEYQEDSLFAPTDANAGLSEPGPGQVGYAPQQRVGSMGGYSESRRGVRRRR